MKFKEANTKLLLSCFLYTVNKDRQCTYKCKIEARLCEHCCSGKAVSITYYECVFLALGSQHAMRVRRIIFSYVACMLLPYFPTLSHKRHDFLKRVIE